MSLRDRVNEAVKDKRPGPERAKAASRVRSKILAESWEQFQGKGHDGVARFSSRGRDVVIARIEYGEEGDNAWVDVWSDPRSVKPSLRIVNPPILVPDPQGDVRVTVTRPDGRVSVIRYREDPVAAIVDALGGSQ